MTEQVNPYQAPSSEVSDVSVREIVAAGKGRRFGTFIVDYIGFLVLVFIVTFVIAIVGGEAGLAALQGPLRFVISCGMFFAYYVFFEMTWGRTPGKFLFGTVVVNEDGGKPTLGQVLGRTAARFIPFEPFSCFGERGWHDSLPKTRVILAKPRS